MKHSDVRRNLSAYLDGSVTSEERTMIEAHLESCRECRVALEELKKTTEYVRDLEEVEPPPWLAGKIMAKAREQAEVKKGIFRRLFFPSTVRLSIEAAALVLVTVTGYLVFRAAGPEMDLVGTTSREESGKAAPSKAAPSAPPAAAPLEKQAAKEKTGVKRKERAVSPKLPEQQREPELKEKRLPATAPEIEYAPAPAAKPVSPESESPALERSEEYSSAPASRAERSMKAAGMADEAKEEAKSGGSARYTAKKAPKRSVEPGISFVLRSAGRPAVVSDVERLVTRLGGRIVKRERSGESLLVKVMIDEGKLDSLREKLGSFGEVAVRGTNYGFGDGTGETLVSIEIKSE